jgi:hypothetical protein
MSFPSGGTGQLRRLELLKGEFKVEGSIWVKVEGMYTCTNERIDRY